MSPKRRVGVVSRNSQCSCDGTFESLKRSASNARRDGLADGKCALFGVKCWWHLHESETRHLHMRNLLQ